MLVSEKTNKKKFASLPTQKKKFASHPMQNPNASQWNIGCVGSLALGLCVGHAHFIFFVLISFASDIRRKPVFQWNMGFRVVFFVFFFYYLISVYTVLPLSFRFLY